MVFGGFGLFRIGVAVLVGSGSAGAALRLLLLGELGKLAQRLEVSV